MTRKPIFLGLFFALCFFPIAGDAAGIIVKNPDELTDIEKTAEKATPAVISVNGYRDMPTYAWHIQTDVTSQRTFATLTRVGTGPRKVTTGTGFFITSDGYILTNRHVVDDPRAEYRINTGSAELSAQIAYKDPDYDLAILKVEGGNFPVIKLSDSAAADIGDEVASVGNALGRYVDSISSGEIISFDESVIAGDGGEIEEMDGLIATDARLYPGDSGGPLLDANGEAIGVNVATAKDEDIGFSIPGEIVRSVVKRAGLGV